MGCDVWVGTEDGPAHSCLRKLMGNQRTPEHTCPVNWTLPKACDFARHPRHGPGGNAGLLCYISGELKQVAYADGSVCATDTHYDVTWLQNNYTG